jgi:hypothetical protein
LFPRVIAKQPTAKTRVAAVRLARTAAFLTPATAAAGGSVVVQSHPTMNDRS